MNINRMVPWNWFRKEDELKGGLPARRETDPLSFSLLRREMDHLFDDFFRDFDSLGMFPSTRNGETWMKPSLDISATDTEYSIHVELPGVSEKDVHVEVAGDTLRIGGEKKHEEEDKHRDYYTVERGYGSFQRVLALPEDAKADDVKATFKHGVMTITIPRRVPATPHVRQIEVKAS